MEQAPGVRPYVIEEYITTVCPQCAEAAPLQGGDPSSWRDGMLVRHSGSIWLRRVCPVHGETESLYEEDAGIWQARHGFAAPTQHTAPDRAGNAGGGPRAYTNGLPHSHGQHTCTLLLNLSQRCSFTCPACYAAAAPGGMDGAAGREPSIPEVLHTVQTMIDREGGRLGVLMLSGGEPAERDDLPELLAALMPLHITRIMLNTNGRRIARDGLFVELLAHHRAKLEVYLQFDGLLPATYLALRGQDLAAEKLSTLERLNAARVYTTLVPAIARGVNEDELGAILRLGLSTPYCAGIAFQPLFGSGRAIPIDPRDRATPSGVIARLAQQSGRLLRAEDFIPLPCPARDCCDIAYLVQGARGRWTPLTRAVGRERLQQWAGLVANTMTFEHLSAPVRELLQGGGLKRLFAAQPSAGAPQLARDIAQLCACAPRLGGLLGALRHPAPAKRRSADCGCAGGCGEEEPHDALSRRTFRITVKMFMDAHTLNYSRLRQCCVHTGTFEDDPRRYPFCWRWLFADATDFPGGDAACN